MGNAHGVSPGRIWKYAVRELTSAKNITSDGNPIDQSKLSYLDATISSRSSHSVADIWSYSTRTLSQDNFPFWTSIMPLQKYSHDIPAHTNCGYNIIPPSGEHWLVYVQGYLATYAGGSYIQVEYYVSGSTDAVRQIFNGNDAVYRYPEFYYSAIADNSHRIFHTFFNNDSSVRYFYIGRCGFKLGTKEAEIELVENELTRKEEIKEIRGEDIPDNIIPSRFRDLKPYMRINRRNELEFMIYEDVPLTIDKETNEVVETVSLSVKVDILDEKLDYFKTHEKQTGWKKVFDYLEEKNIYLRDM